MRHRKTEALGDAVLKFVTTVSLGDGRLRRVFTALTGDNPADTTWWADWTKSRGLRHDVAHGGASVTPEQATLAIDSAAAYIAHLSNVVERVRTS